MKIKNIKACVFDAYGTLFDVNSAAAKCKEKLGDKWEGFTNSFTLPKNSILFPISYGTPPYKYLKLNIFDSL